MVELLNTVTSWRSLLLVLVVFGFAPGFCLRLIILAYPRDDPRRAELIAELYAIPRIQRPLWVAEQLETALFEGFTRRCTGALDRALIRAVARALERGHDFVSVAAARDLAALAQELARELNGVRNLPRELQLARAGDFQHARQLARELAGVRTLELALVRNHDSSHVLAMGGEVETARVSTGYPDIALDRDLELFFERAPAFARALAVVGVLHRVRTLARRLQFVGKQRDNP